jgi:hypothetical protein
MTPESDDDDRREREERRRRLEEEHEEEREQRRRRKDEKRLKRERVRPACSASLVAAPRPADPSVHTEERQGPCCPRLGARASRASS